MMCVIFSAVFCMNALGFSRPASHHRTIRRESFLVGMLTEMFTRCKGAPKPASIVNTLASEIVRGRFGPAPTTSSNGNPVIAITLGTTSRGFRWSKLEESPLVRILLASMARTLEQGFDYRIYVGFDAGDLFYDDEARRDELAQWVENTLVRSAAARGINASFASLRFLNVLRKPGPIFNFLTAAAFADGADFVYRINDDTEFRTPFASALTTALANFKPPYLGVVGPSCADGNKKILTHDFVHRTHYHIFQTYYPVVLTDWWMDDWISKVYPRGNYGRHQDVAVSHHTWMTGSGNPVRYEVDHGHKKYLNTELRRGAQLIGQFSQSHCRGGVCQQPDGHVTPAWSGVYDPKNQTVFDSVMEEDLHRREKEAWDEQDEYAGSRYGYGDSGGEGENQWMETDRDRKGGTAISTSSFDEMEDSSRSNSADKADSQAKAIADGDGKQDADPTDVHIDRPVINHDELNAAAGWDGNWGAGDESGSPSTDGEAENSVEKEFHDVEDCRAKTKCSSLDECARLCGTGGVDVVEGDHHVWKKTEQHVKREEGKTMAMQHRIDKLDSMVAEELHDVFVPRGRDDSPPWGAGASSSDSADHIAEEQKRKQLVGSSTAGSPRGGLDGAGNKETGVGKKGRESSMSKESEGSVQDKIAELERLRAELSQRLEKARDERQKNWENLWESAEAEVEGETAKQQEGGGRGSSASAAFNPDDDDDDWGAAATTTIGAPLSLKQLDKATLSSSKSSKTGGKKRRRQKLKGRSKGDSLSDSAADKLHRQQRGREAAGKGASGSSDPRMLKEKALLDIMQRESDAQSTSARPASAIATQV